LKYIENYWKILKGSSMNGLALWKDIHSSGVKNKLGWKRLNTQIEVE
jgi:hypothetical protein